MLKIVRKRVLVLTLTVAVMVSFMPGMAFAGDEGISAGEGAATEAGVSADANTLAGTDAASDEGAAVDEGVAAEAGTSADAGASADDDAAADMITDDISDGEVKIDLIEDDASDEEAADDGLDDGDLEGEFEITFSHSPDAEEVGADDPEQQMRDFFLDNEAIPKEKGTKLSIQSVKGDRLTGSNLKYYNYYRSIIKKVGSGKRTSSTMTVSLTSFLGKKKFTAKELGVSKIGYKKNGKWHLSDKAQRRFLELIYPTDFSLVRACLRADLPADSYWVDWYTNYQYYSAKGKFSYNKDTITIKPKGKITLTLPVMPDFAKSVSVSDISKIKAALKARNNAKILVKNFDDAIPSYFADDTPTDIDYYRLLYYSLAIAKLTDYDSYAAEDENPYWQGPWGLISVFDNNPNTKTVCVGYANAFKILCDLSNFNSDWIDCQIVSGFTDGNTKTGHMWNIVRMNDGLNYLVDPTWMDIGTTVTTKWMLRGDPAGTADSVSIDGRYRVYNEVTKASFAPAERILARKSQYDFPSNRPISLKGTSLKKPKKGKKSFTVKWKPVTSPIAAMYVDGYQIQYSTKKNFKHAKTKTVKGYRSKSLKIKKLKKKKKYYVRIRTYTKLGHKTYYSRWSKKKKVKTK